MLIGAALVAGGSSRANPFDDSVTNAEIAAILQPADGVRVEHSPRLTAVLDRTRELDCLTQAVYFEARGETPRGQQAVAQVVLNRVRSPAFPKSVCGVVYQGASNHGGCQFSFACDGSTRRGREAGAWDRSRKVAARALSGSVMADVGAATHFHTTGVSPAWAGMTRVAQVGLHVFYRPGPRGGFIQARDAIAEKAVLTSLSASTVAAVASPVHMAATLTAEAASAPAPTADVVAEAPMKTAETAIY